VGVSRARLPDESEAGKYKVTREVTMQPNPTNAPPVVDVNLLDLPAEREQLARILYADFVKTLPIPRPPALEIASRLDEFLIRKAAEIGVRIFYWDSALSLIDTWPRTAEGLKKWNRFSDAIKSSMDTKTRKAPADAALWLTQAARDLHLVRTILLKTKAAELSDIPTLRINLIKILLETNPESIPALCRNVEALTQFTERHPEHFARWIKGHMNDTELARRFGAAQHQYGKPDSFRQAAQRQQTKANRERNTRARSRSMQKPKAVNHQQQ
jgi:hypothetical protein